LFFTYQKGSAGLEDYGRLYGSLLHIQIAADLFIGVFQLMLLVWPKGGAMALSAFREHIRAPLFWLMGGGAVGMLVVAMIVPYFTFGDDYKMMKQICFDVAMLAPVAFGVLMTSISINDEIEGRTAFTVISKPVTRRQFLLGKYVGALMAAFALTLAIGWFLIWVLHIQPRFTPLDPALDPMPAQMPNLMQRAVLRYVPAATLLFLSVSTRGT